jgi:hypothetical protein
MKRASNKTHLMEPRKTRIDAIVREEKGKRGHSAFSLIAKGAGQAKTRCRGY